jgi:hypothetical protein
VVAAPALIRRAATLAAVGAALVPGGATATSLTLGLPDPGLDDSALQKTQELGAGIVRLDVGWPASRRPMHPRDPADPAYDWARTDVAVAAARAHGLRVLLSFTGLPLWAQRTHVPRGVAPSTYRPRAADVGAYGEALARRYPQAAALQVWNEPNSASDLTPQWSNGRPAAPRIYRSMLNAFYTGVRRAHTQALVVTAGTAPFGDAGRRDRMMPVTFWRDLLERPARFDVLAHRLDHPGAPTRHAPNAGDVAVPDMGKLRRLLQHAHGTARLWVTEVSFGGARAQQAHWLEHAFELFWRAGVDTVICRLRDGSETAFRFPFVAGGDQVWTRAPSDGTLAIQRNGRTARRVPVRAGQVVLLHHIRTRRGDVLRGVIGTLRSLPWRASH